MTWVVPLALGGFAILLMVFFTVLSARKRHRQAAAPAVTVGPAILVHDINDDRCTGCDACVAVCPTNVLDLVANKSRVLRFEDCIQCEACMIACPTEALVMFPEHTTPPPLKVPEIDENFQTAVAGQYLIGEVAGKPLVKSAANLGRAVVEHIVQTGLRPGALGRGDATIVDVAIIGSGPGGLSAGLTCIEKKLSFVVLEKEQDIASTINRYPKGKLVMAEPYDTVNLSFLPVFDSSKEQLIPIWRELLDRVGLDVKKGESVESVTRQQDGTFEVRSTVAVYRAQRVILSIGTRGKPRTLQVPGENLPKIFSLLEDPDEWRGKSVLVVGGGDSAVEAALALSDSGAKVTISYRGKGFARAAPKNKQAVEAYAAEGRIKAKLGSQVLGFEADSVALALGDGSQKRYSNDAAFVLIGADPPIAWLEKVGIRFVERPHQYQMGKTDDFVRRFVRAPMGCPEDAARAAAQILGGSTGKQPSRDYAIVADPVAMIGLPMPMGEPVSGPRKWLRSATSIFSNKAGTNPGTNLPLNARAPDRPNKKKLDAPVPLSEFARSQKSGFGPNVGTGVHHTHTGHGRRDALSAGERTRILRMLRDEGGRLADEDSQVYIGAAPPKAFDFDFDDDSPAPAPGPRAPNMPMAPNPRPDVPAKPAQISGLAAAQAKSRRDKRNTAAPAARLELPLVGKGPPPMPTEARNWGGNAASSATESPTEHLQPHHHQQARSQAPEHLPPDQLAIDDLAVPTKTPSRQRPAQPAPPPPRGKGNTRPPRPVPAPFNDEPTRQVDDNILASLRAAELGAANTPRAKLPGQEDPTRLANAKSLALDDSFDGLTVPERGPGPIPARPKLPPPSRNPVDEVGPNDEATRMASLDSIARNARATEVPAALPRPKPGPVNDESTRAVDIRGDRSMSEVDWDLDD